MEEKFTSEMVDAYADKLLIGLSKAENEIVLNEFENIDENIALLMTIKDIDKVEPMSWCLDRCVDALREDIAEESVPLDDLLANSDGVSDREIEVVKVVA